MNKTVMAFILALLGLADNLLTYIAVTVNPNVRELNPIVNFFLLNSTAFAFFTLFKCMVMFFLAYQLNYDSKKDYIIYIIIAAVFCQAIIISTLNIL